jgi:hypothetical protein
VKRASNSAGLFFVVSNITGRRSITMRTRLEYVWRSCVALAVLLALPAVADAQVQIESATFGGLRARAIGPSTMSGRIAAMDAVPEYPLTIYIGAASGGVWKSRDGGLRFEPVFDDHTQSVGAIRIDPSNPDVVWVGTGLGRDR